MPNDCYLCDEPAVGVEHVPPRCLFPKVKDLPKGVALRKNLITVSSCDAHNLEKSRDDVYFQNVITGCDCINNVGREYYRRQIRRQHKLDKLENWKKIGRKLGSEENWKIGIRSFVITFSYAAPECDNERPDPRSAPIEPSSGTRQGSATECVWRPKLPQGCERPKENLMLSFESASGPTDTPDRPSLR